jgi:hypothetical protein
MFDVYFQCETFAPELLAAIENVRVICLMCIFSARLLLQNYWLPLRMDWILIWLVPK